MKKTVSVNIKGINFLIEEDAYELLQDYMDRLTQTLKNEDGSKDIIEDVELRIAEICSSKLSDSKTVIELVDIESILANLGDPEDYVDEEEASRTEEKTTETRSEKRLFRDTENATIAGICAGIANFFHIDVVIVRAIFVVFLLFAGFGFPLYIILWIIIPRAKTSIDRLRMKGRPITVETVREEVENVAENIKTGSKNLARKLRQEDTYKHSASRGVRIIASLIGFGMMGIGVLFLILFLVFGIAGLEFIPVHSDQGFLAFADFGALVLSNDGDFSLFKIGSFLLGSGVILFLLLLGSMLVFNLKNIWAKLSLLGIFLTVVTGGIICAVVGLRTGQDFFIGSEIERTVGHIQTEELVIIPQLEQLNSSSDYKIKSNGGFGLMTVDEDDITLHGIHINYVPSSDSLFHVSQTLSARSHSKKNGIERCENIAHSIELNGNRLYVDTDYSFPKEDKLRNQEIYVMVEIPKGAQVRVKDRIIKLDGNKDEVERNYFHYENDHDDDQDHEYGYLKGNGKYRHDY